MKCPTFQELYERPGTREEYDHVSRLRYIQHDRLILWENGNVDLERGFRGDPAERGRWGKAYRLGVFLAPELPTHVYDFVAPDGYRVKKADLSHGSATALLVDWDQKVAVSLDGAWQLRCFADAGLSRLVRWVHPNARPHTHQHVQIHIADTKASAERRAYLKSVRDPARTMLRVMGLTESGGWTSPEWLAKLDTQASLQDVLDWAAGRRYDTGYVLQEILKAANFHLTKAAIRKPVTYPYLNVRSKS